jgi:hypothetical protein
LAESQIAEPGGKEEYEIHNVGVKPFSVNGFHRAAPATNMDADRFLGMV